MNGRASGRGRAWALALCVLGATRVAAAQSSAGDRVHPLRHDLAVDVALTSFSALVWLGLELEKERIAPAQCRWCGRNQDGQRRLNRWDHGARTRLRWQRERRADVVSSVLAFGVLPATSMAWLSAAAASDSALSGAPLDGLIVAEAGAVALALNQVTKLLLARERPYLFGQTPAAGEVPAALVSRDANLSFFSGHTTLAFALAGASGTVASLRGYDLAPAVWATGLASAAAVGYLRIAADKHYLTDVLVGAAAGAAIGVGLPLLLHGRSEPPAMGFDGRAASAPRAAPLMFSYGGAF